MAESQQGGKSPANKHGAYWREYRLAELVMMHEPLARQRVYS
ncbi:hypothetical protein ACD974_14520 [Escherichia coli]